MRGKNVLGVAAGLTVAAGVAAVTMTGVAGADGAAEGSVPPDGARAVVEISPNPAQRGEEITITGHCGGGSGLKAVRSGISGGPEFLENIRIVSEGPERFEARATVSGNIGNGVGTVAVDCGGQAGVTLLVTRG
ncbi:hypothetical protein CFN78_19175 [Amycolatopsis antarctica]|uniref:Secreted protein n=1 Tax=Amycolatopsis antarctica TaxID=1854586 RepID=A0A263CZP1_9PSEU|nr:hypothetical protein [Amycolatopsis antarctica]OZM71644.1 hypothetical protein CFN78_19175 [Amycolatopsis antarctica]